MKIRLLSLTLLFILAAALYPESARGQYNPDLGRDPAIRIGRRHPWQTFVNARDVNIEVPAPAPSASPAGPPVEATATLTTTLATPPAVTPTPRRSPTPAQEPRPTPTQTLPLFIDITALPPIIFLYIAFVAFCSAGFLSLVFIFVWRRTR